VAYSANDRAISDFVHKTGATIEAMGGVSNSFQVAILSFQARAFQLKVNNHDVWIYEFSDGVSARIQASMISRDGSQINSFRGAGASIDWIAPSHFFESGKLIVFYVGNDLPTINLLSSTLGPQFAGG
jgi:hypothetical protein